MKQANNNEIDLLLRSLAKGRDASALGRGSNSGDGNRVVSDHLDADELNSYAEGVVPAPARARYTEHLADCDMCRGIVINLTQAAGIATRVEVPEQKHGTTLWQKLTTLLSPPVLRFAVPALVLTAVIGIGFIITTRQQFERRGYVAKNEPLAAPAKIQPLQTEKPSGTPLVYDSLSQKKVESPAATEEQKREQFSDDADRNDAGRNKPAEAGKAGEVAGTITGSKDASQSAAEQTNRAELRPYAPEPKAALPPAPSVTTLSEVDRARLMAKEQPAKLDDQEAQRDASKTAPSDEHGPNRSATPRAGTAQTNRRLDGVAAARGGPYGQDKKDKDKGERANENAETETRKAGVETRTVSGKRFVRDGNAWVDTAVDSSRTPIKVARGSEQFRALVADEPGLRAIAEQLNGVVIVVWKSRTYRIQ